MRGGQEHADYAILFAGEAHVKIIKSSDSAVCERGVYAPVVVWKKGDGKFGDRFGAALVDDEGRVVCSPGDSLSPNLIGAWKAMKLLEATYVVDANILADCRSVGQIGVPEAEIKERAAAIDEAIGKKTRKDIMKSAPSRAEVDVALGWTAKKGIQINKTECALCDLLRV